MPYHPALDRASEAKLGARRIGTTGKGVGPAYVDKAARVGIRMADLLDERLFREKLEINLAQKNRMLREIYDAQSFNIEEILNPYLRFAGWLAPYITDTALLLHRWIESGYSVLFEGAQATMLDIDHGTYPYITSSSTTAGGASTGTGVPPTKIHGVLGVAKAYSTRVGAGPFPTEMTGELAETIRARGNEYGATTGRPRRCGWFDAVVLRYAVRINGLDTVALTKLDVLDKCETVQGLHRLPVSRRFHHRVPRGAAGAGRARARLRGHRGLDVADQRRQERGRSAGQGATLSRAPRGADRRVVLPGVHRPAARRDDPVRGLAAAPLVSHGSLEHRLARDVGHAPRWRGGR